MKKVFSLFLILAIILIFIVPKEFFAQLSNATYSFISTPSPNNGTIWDMWGDNGKVFALTNDERIAYYNGSSWVNVVLPASFNTISYSIDGQNINNVLVCGKDGYLCRYNGNTWSQISFPGTPHLRDVNFLGSVAYIVGCNKIFYLYDGSSFTNLTPSTTEIPEDIDFLYVYSISSTEIWIFGLRMSDYKYVIYLYDGSNFTLKYTFALDDALGRVIFADNNNLYFISGKYVLSKFNKTTNIITPIFPSTEYCYGAWMFDVDDIFASRGNPITGSKELYHYDGVSWDKISSTIRPEVFWGFSSSKKLYATDHINFYEIIETTGITALENEGKVSIYPNPTINNVVLELDYKGKVGIQIFDITGKIVRDSQFLNNGENKINLNISDLMPGMYMVVISDESGQKIVKKIVKYKEF